MAQKLRPQAETLSGSPQPNFTGYQAASIIAKRAPTVNDTGYPLGQLWVDKVGGASYQLQIVAAGVATWGLLGTDTGALNTLTGDTGGAISPAAGNINLLGTVNQIATTGSGSTITYSLVGPYTPATYTAHGVLIGEGTSSIAATAAGTTGQVLIGSTGADPAFGALGVNSGLTSHGVLLGENNSAIAATAAGSTGQTLMGSTGADPAFTGSPSFSGSVTAATTITATLGAITATNGNVVLGTSGNKILSTSVASTTTAGANSFGTVALSSGAATVNTSAAKTASLIFATVQALGTVAVAKAIAITARVDSTSFTITSADATDTSTVAWFIVN